MARGQNRHAKSLATLVSSMTDDVPRIIKVELITQPSIDVAIDVTMVSMPGPCWMDRKLYQRSFRGPYLLCLRPKKVNELLAKLHEGVCSSHVGGRLLAHRAMT